MIDLAPKSALVAGDMDTIDPILPVVPQLCDRLRTRIIRGDLLPGTRLSRNALALHYGVSRQPVSEACIRLSEEALVDVLPQRGTFVSRIRVSAVTSARFVREAVESDIMRLLAAATTRDWLAGCDALLADQATVTDGDDPQRFIALDEAFHRHLAAAAGQATGWDVLQPLKVQMDRLRYLTAQQFPRQQLLDQHHAIVAALRAGDGAAAEGAMRAHLQQILHDLPHAVAARPEFFDGAGGAT